MPTLSITSIKQARDVMSTHKVLFFDYTGPSSYSAGGDSFVPNDVGLGNIDFIDVAQAWNGSAVRLVTYDKTAQKLVWYVPNTGAEASGDLSAYSARIMVVGQ
jgi:hypothetical protein